MVARGVTCKHALVLVPILSGSICWRVTFNYSVCRGRKDRSDRSTGWGTVSSFESIHKTITLSLSATLTLGLPVIRAQSGEMTLHFQHVL